MNPQQIAQIIKQEIDKRFKEVAQKTFYRGVVTATNGNYCSVALDGSAGSIPNILCLNGYSPAVDDRVLVLSIGTTGANFIVLGTTNGADPAIGGGLQNIRTYTSNDEWTKPANLKFVIVELQGGGGGGGSSGGTNDSVGAGGAGGGYGRKKIMAADLGSTESVTVGSGGSGGSLTSNRGDTGGTSSFGAHFYATGGQGGGHGGENYTASGGTISGADIMIQGQIGGGGGDIADGGGKGGLRAVLRSGVGGDSFMGFGAYVSNNQGDGRSGNGYGSGGAGGLRNTSSSRGGAGTGGIVIVQEFF